jgi:IS30 family transposase
MKKYTQIKLQERVKIFNGLCAGMSHGDIANLLGRDRSSIGREIRRNGDRNGYLYPQRAQERTDKRKAKHGYMVNRIPGLKEYVVTKLHEYWSPIAIAGRWSLENPSQSITKETLYAWIYSKEGRKLGLPKLLPRGKPKRGMVRARKVKEPIPFRISISKRPESINQRYELGHAEADLMFNRGSQSSNVLTMVDRKSRLVGLVKNESKKAKIVTKAVIAWSEKHAVNSVTCDNGKEFSGHVQITDKLSIPVYFCDPGAPWQKGAVENMNKMLRRFLPFSLNAREISQEKLDWVADALNNTPRAILGFLTPLEAHQNIARDKIKRESRVNARPTGGRGQYNWKISNVALRSVAPK